MTTKKTTAPTHPVPDSKGAKRKMSGAPDKPAFLAELQSLSLDELIQKAKALDATATSAWMPRALTLGELVAREKLSDLPARKRTTRLRALASQTKIGLKTVRQDLRICETFFPDEAKAANWLAREPVSREAFVTALIHPESIEEAYDACVRGEYDRAAFRRYVKAQVDASGAEAEKEDKGAAPQRIRGLPPEVRGALEELMSCFPGLSETAILLKALEALRRQEKAETRREGEKKSSRTSLRKHAPKSPPQAGEGVVTPPASLFAADAEAAVGAPSSASAPDMRFADPHRCRSPEAAG